MLRFSDVMRHLAKEYLFSDVMRHWAKEYLGSTLCLLHTPVQRYGFLINTLYFTKKFYNRLD